MAYHDLARPKLTPPPVYSPPSHERLGPLTGELELRFTTPPGRYVAPGTGRLALLAGKNAEPAHAAARRSGRPVIPGTGIKGAVRTIYEMITGSCDPFDRASVCKPGSCCDACRVFGRLGYLGRAGFGDADAEQSVTVSVEMVPVPHPPHGTADVRCYDLTPSVHPRAQPRQVYRGSFVGVLSFRGLIGDELGKLLLCLGLAPDPQARFPLRLGGVRYDGQGAVDVEPLSLFLATKDLERGKADYEDTGKRCAEWAAAGLAALQEPAVAWLKTYAKTVGGSKR